MLTSVNGLATRAWLAIEQPSPDAGPFAALWDKLGAVLIWGATIAGFAAIVIAGCLFAWERIDPSREAVSGRVLVGAVAGGALVAMAAQIINWSYDVA
ncbi:hypothetical protein AAFP30_27960 [Gordonia sp. CPCC 205515]|uniref:hypothetical protein n=1 Tax=Gordonia sp. CPCC 205515 TaxID=3140791 RepID=UPI003AF3CC8D